MAEVLLRHHLAGAGVEARVRSAGLLRGGAPASQGAKAALAERGLDLSAHRSRRLVPELLDTADVVVGMTREHVREAVVLDRDVLSRAFTLRDLVARAERNPPRGETEAIGTWLARIGGGRRTDDLVGVGLDPDLDIADPIGGPLEGYLRTADLLDDLLARLVARAWPQARTREIA
jgi:protein-tyrosine phosphatase